jgi:FMN phosphatase YigB (HAD superfamily)
VTLEAVVFDVDFTIAKPGPDLGPEGYRTLGLRFGLDLAPSLYERARRDAIATLKRHPELDHDEEVWVLFTERIIEGMGGVGDTYACAVEMTRAWERADHFELFEDALPVLGELRGHGLRLGLLSNTGRDLDAFVAHHGIDVDTLLTSRLHGKTKPRRPDRRRRRRPRGRHARVARRSRRSISGSGGAAARPPRASRGPRAGETMLLSA